MEQVSLEVFDQKEPVFYLFKHKDIDGLQLPLKGSSRVKYTSFNVSNNYIALGTNAGGIHIFRRSSLRHSRFLNAKVFPQPDSSRIVDVGVTTVLFSPQEKLLAAALSSGHVAVWILNFDKREASQLVKKTDEHKGSSVTSLCWNSSSTKLFIGDNKGCVTGLEVGTGKIRRVQTIIKEGPAVVQLDFGDEKLLISNTKRCVFYDPNKEDLVQIGSKERDGLYGACFLFRQLNNENVVYCARPGARLWQVDSSGQVLCTQQYKKLLSTTSTPIIGHLSGNEKGLADKCNTYIFPKLLVLRDQYLITWTRENIIVLDPILGNLILWNNQLDGIEDVCCNRQDMYVFLTGGRLTRYSLIPPKECAAKLFVLGDWLQCSKVLISCKSQIIPVTSRDHVPEYVVRRVKEMLNDNLHHEEIVRELTELEENLERVPHGPATSEDSMIFGASSFDESESRSFTSEVRSNADSESMISTPLDSGMEEEDSIKTDRKEKLTKLKNVLRSQLKEFSLDSVLLAGAKAAGHMSFPSSYANFGSGDNIEPFGSSLDVKNSKYNTTLPSESEGLTNENQSDVATSSTPFSRNDSVGSWEGLESDSEERKIPLVFKQKKKKKMKVNTVDIVSPLQPTDLIKMEKSTMPREDHEKNLHPPKAALQKLLDTTEQDAEPTVDSHTVIDTHSRDSKEGLRSRSVAAKQEVVQKARKFLKRLTPEEKEMGSDETTKTFGGKGSVSKGISTNITSPLEVKSLVIISRETRRKVRETQQLYNPKALKSSLNDWVLYLEKANFAVDLIYPKNKETREYYVTDVRKVLSPSAKADLTRFLDSSDTTTISELTTMCFKMKIYSSRSGNDCGVDEDELVVEELLKCDNCKREQNHLSLSIDSTQLHKATRSDDALKNDLAKTKFLCENFQLLSYQTFKGPVIADCLNHRHLLKSLLRCLDDFTERDAVDDAIDTGDTKVALQFIKEKTKNYQKRLLRHVFRLYYLVPRDVSKLCAEIFPYLHPWEVVLVCLSSSTNLYSNCSDFLIYVTHLIQNHAKKSTNSFDVLNELVSSKDFLILVYHSALILDDLSDSDVRCQCGRPRPGSHQTSFQYEELMIDIIKNFKENYNAEALEKLLKISWNHGYWQGCIQLLVMLGLRTDALKLSLELGDISLLSSVQMWGWLPQSLSEWKFGLEYVAGFQVNTDFERFEKNAYPEKSKKDNDNETIDNDERGPLKRSSKDFEKEHGKEWEEDNSGRFEFVQKGNNQCIASFSDEAFGKQTSNLTNKSHSEQHTCINSTISAEHRSFFIDLKSYVLVMLQKLGAKQTLKIISASQLQKVFFMEEFYYKCILSSLLENHQSPLSHRILREVNDHMWSSKCAALLPQVNQMKEMEISSNSREELFHGKEPVKYYRSLEDAACNWGIDIPFAGSSCCSCPLPLCEKLPGHTQGVIVFSCGHLYHKECNSENYCLTCFHCNLKLPVNEVNTAQSSLTV